MTREDAIRILRKEIECISHTKCEDCILEKVCDPMITTPFDTEYREVYEMAIEALEQERSRLAQITQYRNDCEKLMQENEQLKKALEQEPIDKSAMMYEIYMEGVNMSGEYQGCWVRFKDIESVVDRYIRR